MGIYRQSKSSRLRYVVTVPDPHSKVESGDILIVLDSKVSGHGTEHEQKREKNISKDNNNIDNNHNNNNKSYSSSKSESESENNEERSKKKIPLNTNKDTHDSTSESDEDEEEDESGSTTESEHSIQPKSEHKKNIVHSEQVVDSIELNEIYRSSSTKNQSNTKS